MAVPSSGQLRLRADINEEVNGNNTDNNVSLGTLSNDVGFADPDNMSEFYGYTSCSTPTGVGMNILGAATPVQFFCRGRYTGSNGGCNVNSYGFYMGTNSSGPTANTKYESGTDNKGIYSIWDKTFTGLTPNTTYYIWVYVSNVAGHTGYSPMSTRTTQPPYISAQQNAGATSCSGDTNVYGCNGASYTWSWNLNYRDAYTGFTDGGSFTSTHSSPYAYKIPGNVAGCPTTLTNYNQSNTGAMHSLAYQCVLPGTGGPTFNTTVTYAKSGYTSRVYSACTITCTD
jgi:hypothetical protein|tara:strand:+ start:813 stop:1667 length:855 start_codon:yes stop_codon:yes gene_type:complete